MSDILEKEKRTFNVCVPKPWWWLEANCWLVLKIGLKIEIQRSVFFCFLPTIILLALPSELNDAPSVYLMPKAKKRKTPITSSLDTQQASSSNPQATRTLIRSFHVLLKKQTQLQNASQNSANILALADIEREIEKLGGLEAYQRMSSIGQGDDRGGGSEKILIDWLREQGKSSRGTNDKLRYTSCSSSTNII